MIKSQTLNETHTPIASHKSRENHYDVVSHYGCETQGRTVSQNLNETHEDIVSHLAGGTHGTTVSQNKSQRRDNMKKLAVDWAHSEKKLAVFDGTKVRATLPKDLGAGDQIYVENIPMRYAAPLLDRGVEFYRCRPNDTAGLREGLGLEKTDEGDAKLIWMLMEKAPEVFRRWEGDPPLFTMYKQYKEIVKSAAQNKNRAWAKNEATTKDLIKDLEAIKRRLSKNIEAELSKYSIWPWLKGIKGIGVGTAAGLVANIAKIGIENFDAISSVWHYAGVYPVNGKAARRAKGQAMSYNPTLKTLVLGEVGSSFKIHGGFYRQIYDRYKEYELSRTFPPGELAAKYHGYKESDTHLSKGHADIRAIRKATKLFLSHMWVIWRQLEGLSTRPPYVHEKLKHETYIKPPNIPAELLPFKPF